MGEKGNRYWMRRSSHGRDPIFANADDLWTAACEYFESVEDNPLYETKAFQFQGEVTLQEIPKMRAMTIGGLCLFLDICKETYANYRSRDDFVVITSRIDETIRSQKFEGASADLLNANIIARDLGLKDSTDITSGGKAIKNEWHIHPVSVDK